VPFLTSTSADVASPHHKCWRNRTLLWAIQNCALRRRRTSYELHRQLNFNAPSLILLDLTWLQYITGLLHLAYRISLLAVCLNKVLQNFGPHLQRHLFVTDLHRLRLHAAALRNPLTRTSSIVFSSVCIEKAKKPEHVNTQ